MTPDQAKADYRAALKDRIIIRRNTGIGANRPFFQVEDVRARVMGYEPRELVGNIQEGDRKIIAYADDLIAAGFALPVTTNDKIWVRGKELAIIAANDSTRRVEGVLIALELQVRG